MCSVRVYMYTSGFVPGFGLIRGSNEELGIYLRGGANVRTNDEHLEPQKSSTLKCTLILHYIYTANLHVYMFIHTVPMMRTKSKERSAAAQWVSSSGGQQPYPHHHGQERMDTHHPMDTSHPTGEYIPIRESVDSLCRDGADTHTWEKPSHARTLRI